MTYKNPTCIRSKSKNYFYRDMLNLVIKQICQQSDDGRLKELMAELGINERDVKLFCDLHNMHIERLSKSRIQLFKIEINPESIQFVERELDRIRLMERCVKLGASNEFLYDMFGLTTRDAYSHRVLAAVDSKRSRRAANIKQMDLIIDQFLILSDGDQKKFGAKEYCELCEILIDQGHEISLRVVWATVKEYCQACEKGLDVLEGVK